MKKLILIAALLLSGCSGLQSIKGYEQTALVQIKDVNDNILGISVTAICGAPYSTILRHPELWDAINKLCGASQSSMLKGGAE